MNYFLKEIKATMSLGVPLVIAQLCTMGMSMTDAMLVGHGVGTKALAAMAFGLNFMNIPCIALFGLGTATSILVANAFGAGKTKELPTILRHGILLSFLASTGVVSLMCFIFNHLAWFGYLGQPPELIPIARPYLYYFGAAFVFQLCAGNCRAYCESQNNPWLPLYVILGSISANAILDYALIFGVFGLPKMGLIGAGIATLICSIGQFFSLVFIIPRKNLNLTLGELIRPEIRKDYTKKILKIGVPTALQIGVEIAAMTIVALFAGCLGAETLAAHHVTMQVVGLFFMVPMGMSFAVSIRVSQASGAGDRFVVRRVCQSGMLLAIAWMSLSSTILLSLHSKIPMIFTSDRNVIAISSGFLMIAGIFQIFDGIQCTATGALRGLKDVTKPLFIAFVIYWLVEIPISWTLCFKAGLGGNGIWMAMFIGLTLAAVFLSARLKRMIAL